MSRSIDSSTHTTDVYTPLSTDNQTNEFVHKPPTKTINDIFETDKIIKPKTPKKTESKKEPFELLKTLKSFLTFTKKEEDSSSTINKTFDTEAVQFKPTLDIPAELPLTLRNFKLPQLSCPSNKMSDEDTFERLSNLSDCSMYRIIAIISAEQNKLSHERAMIHINDFEQFQKMQAFQQRVLNELKAALLKDESFKSIFKTIQNVSAAVATISGIASFFGFTFPITGLVSGVSTVVSLGAKSYYDIRSDEKNATLTHLGHEVKTSQEQMNISAEEIGKASEDTNNEKIMADILRSQLRLVQMITQKNKKK